VPATAGAQRRGSGDDLIAELFERLHELVFAEGIVAGASYVLDVLLDVIPCELALVHVFDLNTRKFVVVRSHGPGLERALLEATADTDPLIAEVMHKAQAVQVDAAADPRLQNGRWRAAASPLRHVLCGAVRQGGRYLGLIELGNPAGGTPFAKNEINALDYACEQFAEFVATHPVVIDRDAVLGS
jgi:GAF domain-containing protein